MYVYIYFAVLGIESMVLSMLGKHYTSELYLSPGSILNIKQKVLMLRSAFRNFPMSFEFYSTVTES